MSTKNESAAPRSGALDALAAVESLQAMVKDARAGTRLTAVELADSCLATIRSELERLAALSGEGGEARAEMALEQKLNQLCLLREAIGAEKAADEDGFVAIELIRQARILQNELLAALRVPQAGPEPRFDREALNEFDRREQAIVNAAILYGATVEDIVEKGGAKAAMDARAALADARANLRDHYCRVPRDGGQP